MQYFRQQRPTNRIDNTERERERDIPSTTYALPTTSLESLTCQAFAEAPDLQRSQEAFFTVDWDGAGLCDKADLATC